MNIQSGHRAGKSTKHKESLGKIKFERILPTNFNLSPFAKGEPTPRDIQEAEMRGVKKMTLEEMKEMYPGRKGN